MRLVPATGAGQCRQGSVRPGWGSVRLPGLGGRGSVRLPGLGGRGSLWLPGLGGRGSVRLPGLGDRWASSAERSRPGTTGSPRRCRHARHAGKPLHRLRLHRRRSPQEKG